jgi:membrane protease subunit (stomatin/prohibitin family)
MGFLDKLFGLHHGRKFSEGGHHGSGHDSSHAYSNSTGRLSCPTCGESNDAHARFCQQCGKSMLPEPRTCQQCGHPQKSGAKFCTQCGQAS